MAICDVALTNSEFSLCNKLSADASTVLLENCIIKVQLRYSYLFYLCFWMVF